MSTRVDLLAGVRVLELGDGVAGFKARDGGMLEVHTKSGGSYPADLVILALGVRRIGHDMSANHGGAGRQRDGKHKLGGVLAHSDGVHGGGSPLK